MLSAQHVRHGLPLDAIGAEKMLQCLAWPTGLQRVTNQKVV
jgi:hypothetical protein